MRKKINLNDFSNGCNITKSETFKGVLNTFRTHCIYTYICTHTNIHIHIYTNIYIYIYTKIIIFLFTIIVIKIIMVISIITVLF